jgi:hypothetical protein
MRETGQESETVRSSSPTGREELKAHQAKQAAPKDHPAASKQVLKKAPQKPSTDDQTQNPKHADNDA